MTGGFAGMQLRSEAKQHRRAAALHARAGDRDRAAAALHHRSAGAHVDARRTTATARFPQKLGIVFTGAREVQPRRGEGAIVFFRRRRVHRRPRAAQREAGRVEHRRGLADRRSEACGVRRWSDEAPHRTRRRLATTARLHPDRSDRRLRAARAGADAAARHAVRCGAAGALVRRTPGARRCTRNRCCRRWAWANAAASPASERRVRRRPLSLGAGIARWNDPAQRPRCPARSGRRPSCCECELRVEWGDGGPRERLLLRTLRLVPPERRGGR